MNISMRRPKIKHLPLMHEDVAEERELGFEASDSERRLIQLDLLFVKGMRGVIAAKNVERAVCETFKNRFDIPFAAQRRIHLVVAVKGLKAFVRQRDVMRANFA